MALLVSRAEGVNEFQCLFESQTKIRLQRMKLLLGESPIFEVNNNDDDIFHYPAAFPFERVFKEESTLFSEQPISLLISLRSLYELPLLRKGR